jgi:hypothetical protein
MQTMKDWYDQKPELFNKKPVALTAGKSLSNRPGCDSYTPVRQMTGIPARAGVAVGDHVLH